MADGMPPPNCDWHIGHTPLRTPHPDLQTRPLPLRCPTQKKRSQDAPIPLNRRAIRQRTAAHTERGRMSISPFAAASQPRL